MFAPLRTLRVLRMGLPQCRRRHVAVPGGRGRRGSPGLLDSATLQYLFSARYKDRPQDIFFVEVHTIAWQYLFCVAAPRGGVAGFRTPPPWGVVTSRARTVHSTSSSWRPSSPRTGVATSSSSRTHAIRVADSRGGPHSEDEDRFRNIFRGGPHTRGRGSLGQGRSPPPPCPPPGLPLLGSSAPGTPSATGPSRPRT